MLLIIRRLKKRASWRDDRVHAHRLVDCLRGISGLGRHWCEGRLNGTNQARLSVRPERIPRRPHLPFSMSTTFTMQGDLPALARVVGAKRSGQAS